MFWHKLAVTLGMSIREAQSTISLEEFRWWIAYDRISPIGLDRMDAHAASICAAVSAPYLPKGKRPKIADYLINWGKKVAGITGKQMEAMLTHYAPLHNRKFKNGGN